MLHRSSINACRHGYSLLRWWASSVNQLSFPSHSHLESLTAQCQRSYTSASQVTPRFNRIPRRSTRSPPSPSSEQQQPSEVSVVSPRSLEAADQRESKEDEAASSTPAAIHRQLDGLNAIAASLQADIAQHNAALQQHHATAPAETVKRMKHRAATLRDSYAALLESAWAAHHKHVYYTRPHSHAFSRMSAQLAAMERVWVDMCAHSQPTKEVFTLMVKAYGREARRTRIRDLLDRWTEDRDRYVQANQKSEEADSQDERIAESVDEDSLEVREEKERNRLRAASARRLREAAMGLPPSVSLYPAIRLDTIAYNAALSSYLSSLSLDQLTSQSKELTFPLSLLPRFKADTHTITTLIRAHGLMGETAQVLQLLEQYKQMRREARLARGGARELQEVRKKRKEEQQYVTATLIQALAKAKDMEAAEVLWAEVKEKESAGQLAINRVMYHSMLAVYAVANEQEKMRSISVEMSRAGLAMDQHSVCTVLKRLCDNGHIADAIMLHTRIPHGSLGPAKQHRMTYMCLLRELAQRADIPFLTAAEVYRQGRECGLLHTARPVRSRTGDELEHPLMGKWVANLRGIPLEVVPVALHAYLSELLDSYMAAARLGEKRPANRTVLPWGMLILLGSTHAEATPKQAMEQDWSSQLRAVDGGQRDGHRLSITQIDWDEEGRAEEVEGVEEQDDENDIDELTNGVRGRSDRSSVLVDPFASEDERGLLSQLDSMKVKGTYVQRYVQHLLGQEWPKLNADLVTDKFNRNSNGNTPHAAGRNSADPSSPTLDSASTSPPSDPVLRMSRDQLMYWLAWHAHVLGDDAKLFPTPHVRGRSTLHVQKLADQIRQKQRDLQARQKQWEGARRGRQASASTAGAVEQGEPSEVASLVDQLAVYKKREREELQVKARVFNTKQLPAAATERRESRERPAAVQSSWLREEVNKVKRADVERRLAGAVPRKRSTGRWVRPAGAEVLSAETLSSLMDANLAPATRQALHLFQQQQQQSEVSQTSTPPNRSSE